MIKSKELMGVVGLGCLAIAIVAGMALFGRNNIINVKPEESTTAPEVETLAPIEETQYVKPETGLTGTYYLIFDDKDVEKGMYESALYQKAKVSKEPADGKVTDDNGEVFTEVKMEDVEAYKGKDTLDTLKEEIKDADGDAFHFYTDADMEDYYFIQKDESGEKCMYHIDAVNYPWMDAVGEFQYFQIADDAIIEMLDAFGNMRRIKKADFDSLPFDNASKEFQHEIQYSLFKAEIENDVIKSIIEEGSYRIY